MAKSKDKQVKKDALSEESSTPALQRIDEMMEQLSERHAAALRKIAEQESRKRPWTKNWNRSRPKPRRPWRSWRSSKRCCDYGVSPVG